MRQTLVLLRFVVALSALAALPAASSAASAGDAAGNARLHEETREVQSWLNQIKTAAQKLNYSGTFVYQQGDQMRASRITHLLDGRDEREKLEILDGKPREYVRNNEEIVCYMPEAKTLFVEKRITHDVFPAIVAANPVDLAEFYDMSMGESGRVAGHECQSIVLQPRDNLRYGYKLWADKASGLLLRAQTLNERNEMVEQIAFTQIAIGKVERQRVLPSFPDTKGWRVEHAMIGQGNLSGWTVRSMPPGFRKIREVKRLVSDAVGGAASVAGTQVAARPAQREVSQIVFSDGLAAISVFIEPGAQSRTEGSMQQGAMNIIGKRHGDFWLTIVGEVPLAALKQIASSIEFKPR